VTVFNWYPLQSLSVIDMNGDKYDYLKSSDAVLNGTVYENSLSFGRSGNWSAAGYDWSSGWAVFNLERNCTTFRAWPGIETSSEGTGGVARLRVWREDAEAPLKGNTGTYYAPGHVEIPVANVLRLRIELDHAPESEGGNLVLGTPQVRCAFDPA
jgi:hypothetical protein